MESLSLANSGFALDLYLALNASSPNANLFFSPLSITTIFAITYLGARTTTAEEMEKVLGFGSVSDVHTQFKYLNNKIKNPSNFYKPSYSLQLASKLYGDKTFSFLPEFLDSTQKFYEAEMQTVDFMGAADETRKLINQWVEEKTEGKVKDLLKPGMVDSGTRLALVNAIYFKDRWQEEFEPKDTEEKPFKINQNETRPVQMMFQVKQFPHNYIPEYKVQVLELPYLRHDLSMLILLPDETQDGSDPLQKLESELTVNKLLNWTKEETLRQKEVHVYLPMFKVEEQYSLKETLDKMGMSSLFQGSADLTGMSQTEGLYVSSVIHKAFIDVNEEGTEAAAVTHLMLEGSALITETATFNADHPFLFFIRHRSTNSILFMGRLRNPQ